MNMVYLSVDWSFLKLPLQYVSFQCKSVAWHLLSLLISILVFLCYCKWIFMVPVLVRALRRNRTNRRYMFHIRNWLTQLWVSQVHSNTLAWKMSWTEEPVRLQSMGSLRVGYDWAASLSLFTCMHWRRKWQPTPVFLPGESQGRGSLLGCRLWGCTESDTTEAT